MTTLIPIEAIEQQIITIRGMRVLLDSDLAQLYGVPTKRLNEQVRRNKKRFPPDFMIQLTQEEHERLRLQIATLKTGRGLYRKYLPYAFTEQGVSMLSSVLNTEQAILVNVEIMRAFVRLRGLISAHKDLVYRIDELEKKYDENFRIVFTAIRKLMETPPEPEKKPIGFNPKGVKEAVEEFTLTSPA